MKPISFLLTINMSLAMIGCGSDGADWLIESPEAVQALFPDRGSRPPPDVDSGRIGNLLDELKEQALREPTGLEPEQPGTLLFTIFHDPAGMVEGPLDPINCRATVCITPHGRVRLSDFEFDESEYQAVITRHGVNVMQLWRGSPDDGGPFQRSTWRPWSPVQPTPRDRVPDTVGYGAWLDHSAFATLAGPFYRAQRDDGFSVMRVGAFHSGASDEGEYIARVGAFSFGERTGRPPVDGSATWDGVMTGIDMIFNHPIQGDARVTADFDSATDNPTVDVHFTKITDLETRTRLTRPLDLPLTSPNEAPEMYFLDLPLTDRGGFGASDDNKSIEGWFHGPKHEEAGGVFHHGGHQMIGAFGAKRLDE